MSPLLTKRADYLRSKEEATRTRCSWSYVSLYRCRYQPPRIHATSETSMYSVCPGKCVNTDPLLFVRSTS